MPKWGSWCSCLQTCGVSVQSVPCSSAYRWLFRWCISCAISFCHRMKVELKAMAPPHCSFSVSGNSLEYLIGISPEIMAYGYHRGINECYAGTSRKFVIAKNKEEYPSSKELVYWIFQRNTLQCSLRNILCDKKTSWPASCAKGPTGDLLPLSSTMLEVWNTPYGICVAALMRCKIVRSPAEPFSFLSIPLSITIIIPLTFLPDRRKTASGFSGFELFNNHSKALIVLLSLYWLSAIYRKIAEEHKTYIRLT